MDKQAVTDLRDEIIEASLAHVPFDGWVWETIVTGAEDAGHRENVARAVFPGRVTDVLDGFADLADRKMIEALGGVSAQDLRIRDRISTALMKRYEYLQPHKDAVRQSLAFWIVPTRKPRAAQIVWRTADRIWIWAGDTSRDYNRYTKRGLLSGIIVSTTLAWMDDKTATLETTRRFLDRRIENVMQLNKVIGKFKKTS